MRLAQIDQIRLACLMIANINGAIKARLAFGDVHKPSRVWLVKDQLIGGLILQPMQQDLIGAVIGIKPHIKQPG